MQHTLIDSQRVNKRLQRRPRRPLGLSAVDLPINLRVIEIRRAHHRFNRHGARVHQHGRRVAQTDASIARDVAAQLPLDHLLQRQVQRRNQLTVAPHHRKQPIDQMRRTKR